MSKLFKAILKIIAIILIIIAIIYTASGALVYMNVITAASATAWLGFGVLTFTSAWGLLAVAALAVGLAFIVDKETAQKTLSKVVDGVTSIVGAAGSVVAGAAGAAVGGVLSGLTDSGIIPVIALGVGGYLLFRYVTRDKPEPSRLVLSQDNGGNDVF